MTDQLIPLRYTWGDATSCEHNPDEACEPCDEAGLTHNSITLDIPQQDLVPGAPFGSMWESNDDGGHYTSAMIDPDTDVDAVLRADGYDPEEG